MHVHGGEERRALGIAFGLIVALMVGEIVAGIVGHSLALLSDAAHMLTDAGAIALGLFALRLAGRPSGGNLTFGLRRAEVLSAQANGATLLVLAGLISYEAIRRLVTPVDTGGWTMVVVGCAGILVNILATRELARADRDNLAVEGSFQHVLTDLFAFIGTVIAGGVIVATGFTRADPIASLFVVALMLRAAYGLLRDSGRILLEAAPAGMDVDAIGAALIADPRVMSVHDLHVWQIGSGFPALSAHVLVRPGDDCHAVRRDLEQLLRHRFELRHTTLQVDHVQPSAQAVQLGEAVVRRTPADRR
ncbi:MAG TPA: cation diffusion facilitator family transporter [Gaiellaceae bacterium]|jgi:cobalt-zinc-cadmium efflux system protein|nr:cation diffusion facilitator family transporter [Gaiellaceae bacterium]